MDYLIIVSRYNEDINWLQPVMNNTIIINKGKQLNINNEIPLENVGRESHSYLCYIINAYDNLPDILVFTQADISDHREKNDSGYLLQMKEQACIQAQQSTIHTCTLNSTIQNSTDISAQLYARI